MSSIPQEIIEENILSRLPVKSISRFRCVCKNWCILFKNPRFIKVHLQHAVAMNNFSLLISNQKNDHNKPTNIYICSIDHSVLPSKNLGAAVGIDYPFMSKKCPSQLIGSCNGLVCMELYGRICIWNPYTKEYKQVPETPIESPSAAAGYIQISYGFGFDCKVDDYKLLRIVGFAENEVSEARVYALRSNSWKSLGFVPYDFSKDRNRGHLVNGVLHWIAVAARRTGSKPSRTAVSFDISDETFHDTLLPGQCWINHGMSQLGEWEGKLCLVLKHSMDDTVVWTMKDYIWSKQNNIAEEIADMIYGRPIQIFQNGEILFKSYLWKEQKVGLISYDPKLGKARVLKIPGIPKLCGIEPYIETLVSLNSGTFLGQEHETKN